jgi:hypothetical protein
MATAAGSELRVDVHSIEPIPEATRTPPDYLSGADLSWLVGIVVAGGVYLLLSQRVVSAPVPRPMRGAGH